MTATPAWFGVALLLGRLLRSARYASTRVVRHDGQPRVRKRRAPFAPMLVRTGGWLFRILDTGVRVLPQREWEERERLLHRALRGTSIEVEPDGTLVLPCLAGATLAAALEDPRLDAPARRRAIVLATRALAALHARGFTHGDAMAENVMVDLAAGSAEWFDFETVHDPGRPLGWRRADDVRALLATTVLRVGPGELAATVELLLDAYADDAVAGALAGHFTPAFRRPLTFHLGQAGLTFRQHDAIARALRERSRPPGARP